MYMIKYKRILVKISGEALSGGKGFGIDNSVVESVASQLKKVNEMGVAVGVVVGGGNFWRGRQAPGMDRSTADYIGMLATSMNGLALQAELERQGVDTRLQTALTITKVAEPFIVRKALNHLVKGRVVIFACGTGSPYFTTDTAAALRAAEIHADVLLLGKNVDGVYDSDPKVNKDAVRFERIGYMEVINRKLKAMDTTAITMCMENRIPILTFAAEEKDSIVQAVMGINTGTIID